MLPIVITYDRCGDGPEIVIASILSKYYNIGGIIEKVKKMKYNFLKKKVIWINLFYPYEKKMRSNFFYICNTDVIIK